jgi:hypothetical protein
MICVVRHLWIQHVTGAEVPKRYKVFATIHEVSVPHVRKIKCQKKKVNEMNIWL